MAKHFYARLVLAGLLAACLAFPLRPSFGQGSLEKPLPGDAVTPSQPRSLSALLFDPAPDISPAEAPAAIEAEPMIEYRPAGPPRIHPDLVWLYETLERARFAEALPSMPLGEVDPDAPPGEDGEDGGDEAGGAPPEGLPTGVPSLSDLVGGVE